MSDGFPSQRASTGESVIMSKLHPGPLHWKKSVKTEPSILAKLITAKQFVTVFPKYLLTGEMTLASIACYFIITDRSAWEGHDYRNQFLSPFASVCSNIWRVEYLRAVTCRSNYWHIPLDPSNCTRLQWNYCPLWENSPLIPIKLHYSVCWEKNLTMNQIYIMICQFTGITGPLCR